MLGGPHWSWGLVFLIVQVLTFDWWHVPAVLVESAVVEPINPLGGSVFDGVNSPPGAKVFDEFSFV